MAAQQKKQEAAPAPTQEAAPDAPVDAPAGTSWAQVEGADTMSPGIIPEASAPEGEGQDDTNADYTPPEMSMSPTGRLTPKALEDEFAASFAAEQAAAASTT
jgi:hypothetical protein